MIFPKGNLHCSCIFSYKYTHGNTCHYLLSTSSYSIRGGKTCLRSSVADGRSEGLGDIKRRNSIACSGNSATQSEGSSPFCLRSDRTMCRSIAVVNGCHSSRKTIPKLYMSACQDRSKKANVFQH